jgi:hypothetical protein
MPPYSLFQNLAFYFVAVGIIFVVCISILCLIFIPKVRASRLKPAQKRRHSSGAPGISQTQSEAEISGVQILSSPKVIAELEEEIRKLKEIITRSSHVSNNDSEAGYRRLSHLSNALSNDAVEMEPEQRMVTFASVRSCEEENHTEMNVVDDGGGEGGDIEKKEKFDTQVVNGGDVTNGEEENHTEMNVVDEEGGGGGGDIEEEEKVDTQVDVVNGGDVTNGEEENHTEINVVDEGGGGDIEEDEKVDNQVSTVKRTEESNL